MKKTTLLVMMFAIIVSATLSAETYVCNNNRYGIQIFNHQNMGHTATAIIFQDLQTNREVTFRAQDVSYVVTYGAAYSASTFGQAIQEITLSISNFDIQPGQSTQAVLNIRSRYGDSAQGVTCTRGGDSLPSMF
ncbi:MAG: hypothetical protein HN353_08975 [Bdellovibrionales bacterium]|jgi:hypothetical protein|nr:hypothetical protein [Bdellovibrionales bacterium]MBT3525710.1 hypothetical protein [Bdellovibrionales bacterium]MBT7669261.1 hypothetical protein [Bdellovibrionales bacterium]MBT7767701.1 hypothetical protein [Bdellovibrionales bacterium]